MDTQTTELAKADLEIARLSEEMPQLPDPILNLRNKLEAAARFVKEMRDRLDEQVFRPWLEANGGKLESGDMLYVVGKNKTERCDDVRAVLTDIEKASGGDYGVVCSCLSANALKPGAVREVIGDDLFKQRFTTTYSDKITVKAISTRFIK